MLKASEAEVVRRVLGACMRLLSPRALSLPQYLRRLGDSSCHVLESEPLYGRSRERAFFRLMVSDLPGVACRWDPRNAVLARMAAAARNAPRQYVAAPRMRGC